MDRWGCRGGFCERKLRAALMSDRARSSRLQQTQDTAEPVSDVAGVFVIKYIRKGKKCCREAVR